MIFVYFQCTLKSNAKQRVAMGLVFKKLNSLMVSTTVVTIQMKVNVIFILLIIPITLISILTPRNITTLLPY